MLRSDFLTTQKTEPPQLGIWYFVLLGAVLLIIYLSYRYYARPGYQRFFAGVQVLQLLSLYSWYALTHSPLAESLPLYHCRLAMFAILLLPRDSLFKQYFALLGAFGSVAAFIYPVFDAFPFPHLTILSFIIGHLALLGNCLIYLFRHYDSRRLSWRQIGGITFAFNAFLLLVNGLTQGAYGFLKEPPLVGNHGQLPNFLIVSAVLSLAVCLTSAVFKYREDKEGYRLT